MAALTAAVGILGYIISSNFNLGLSGTGIFLLIAAVINLIAYYYSDKLVIASTRAISISKRQAPEIYKIVGNLCKTNNLAMPKIYYIDEDAMNAFATGRDEKHASVVVTRGLIEKLTEKEVESVIAHEIAHIKNSDMKILAIATALAGIISIIADMYWRASIVNTAADQDRSGAMAMVGMVFALIAPISASLVKLAVSRKREYAADALGARMVGRSKHLISALDKISRDQLPLPNASHSTAHLYFSNPFKSKDFVERILSTHPPIEERIKVLTQIKL